MSVEIEQTLECLTHENTFGQDALVRRWIVTISHVDLANLACS